MPSPSHERISVASVSSPSEGARADEIAFAATALASGDALPVGLRSSLASLHGNANKLLATRLDAIVTGDLTSGKEEARAKRKELVAAAEALIERTEQQIRLIDERKAGVGPDGIAVPPPSDAGDVTVQELSPNAL